MKPIYEAKTTQLVIVTETLTEYRNINNLINQFISHTNRRNPQVPNGARHPQHSSVLLQYVHDHSSYIHQLLPKQQRCCSTQWNQTVTDNQAPTSDHKDHMYLTCLCASFGMCCNSGNTTFPSVALSGLHIQSGTTLSCTA